MRPARGLPPARAWRPVPERLPVPARPVVLWTVLTGVPGWGARSRVYPMTARQAAGPTRGALSSPKCTEIDRPFMMALSATVVTRPLGAQTSTERPSLRPSVGSARPYGRAQRYLRIPATSGLASVGSLDSSGRGRAKRDASEDRIGRIRLVMDSGNRFACVTPRDGVTRRCRGLRRTSDSYVSHPLSAACPTPC